MRAEPAMGSGTPWFVDAFGAQYLDVYRHRDLDSARREARWLVEQGLAGRVLDLCCGFGRHTAALSELGLDVVGLDLSEALLRRATELEVDARWARRLVRADARQLPFGPASFDALVNLFSSFGYFGAAGDEGVLDEIARVLRPAGLAFLDLMNPARVRATLVPESRSERDGFVLKERRRLEEDGRLVVKDVEIVGTDGAIRRWTERVRMYETAEIETLLGARGLQVEAVAGDFGATPPGPSAPRQILRVRKGRAAGDPSL